MTLDSISFVFLEQKILCKVILHSMVTVERDLFWGYISILVISSVGLGGGGGGGLPLQTVQLPLRTGKSAKGRREIFYMHHE